MDMNFWRRCSKLTLMDWITNNQVREMMEEDIDIMDVIDPKRLK